MTAIKASKMQQARGLIHLNGKGAHPLISLLRERGRLLRHLAEVLVEVLDHGLVLKPRRLRQRREAPPVRLHRVQLASLHQELDTVLKKVYIIIVLSVKL